MIEVGKVFLRSGGFPGAQEMVREAAEAEFIDSRYELPVLMTTHTHDFPFIHVVLSGRVHNKSEGKAESAEVAQVSFIPAYQPHETLWQGDGQGFTVAFSAKKAAEWFDWGILPHHQVNLDPGLVSALMFAVRRECFANDPVGGIGADSYLAEALAELMRLPHLDGEQEHRSQRMWKAREILSETYDSLPSLSEIAHQVEVHPVYLARAFRHAFGETVGDCIRRRRIEAACHLIARSEQSLTEIAHEVGFADQSHFTRTFKRCIGIPPIEYVKIVRKM